MAHIDWRYSMHHLIHLADNAKHYADYVLSDWKWVFFRTFVKCGRSNGVLDFPIRIQFNLYFASKCDGDLHLCHSMFSNNFIMDCLTKNYVQYCLRYKSLHADSLGERPINILSGIANSCGAFTYSISDVPASGVSALSSVELTFSSGGVI